MKIACPRCGANIIFLPNKQKCFCNYCGSLIKVEELEQFETENTNEGEYLLDEYCCSSCGAQLIANKDTILTDCI